MILKRLYRAFFPYRRVYVLNPPQRSFDVPPPEIPRRSLSRPVTPISISPLKEEMKIEIEIVREGDFSDIEIADIPEGDPITETPLTTRRGLRARPRANSMLLTSSDGGSDSDMEEEEDDQEEENDRTAASWLTENEQTKTLQRRPAIRRKEFRYIPHGAGDSADGLSSSASPSPSPTSDSEWSSSCGGLRTPACHSSDEEVAARWRQSAPFVHQDYYYNLASYSNPRKPPRQSVVDKLRNRRPISPSMVIGTIEMVHVQRDVLRTSA